MYVRFPKKKEKTSERKLLFRIFIFQKSTDLIQKILE